MFLVVCFCFIFQLHVMLKLTDLVALCENTLVFAAVVDWFLEKVCSSIWRYVDGIYLYYWVCLFLHEFSLFLQSFLCILCLSHFEKLSQMCVSPSLVLVIVFCALRHNVLNYSKLVLTKVSISCLINLFIKSFSSYNVVMFSHCIYFVWCGSNLSQITSRNSIWGTIT